MRRRHALLLVAAILACHHAPPAAGVRRANRGRPPTARILTVTSDGAETAGASVSIDGRVLGTTPLTVELSQGIHEFVVSSAGRSAQSTETMFNGERLLLRLDLRDPPVGIEQAKEFVNRDPAMIDRRIKNYLPGIQSCYEHRLAHVRDLHGKLIAHFIITKTGDVTESWLKSSTMDDEETERCVADEFLKMKFESLPGAEGSFTTVNYPLLFKFSY